MEAHNYDEGNSKKVCLRKIPLYDLLKLMEHLYESGADFVDIIGVSMGEDTQDEIMVAVQDEYMKDKQDSEEDDKDHAEIILPEEDDDDDDENLPAVKEIQARITEQDINDLLNGY